MFFISAPFGNYLKFKNAISVTGSWTVQPRPGLLKQIVKTLRYTKTGWRNKIGLRNKGILHAIAQHNYNDIMSLAAIDKNDWYAFESFICFFSIFLKAFVRQPATLRWSTNRCLSSQSSN